MFVVSCPGIAMLMTPPHMHMHFEVLLSIGTPPNNTVGDPGVHGVVVLGMHGIGVNTPSAAAVAAATVGFAGDMQTPNGRIFTIGAWSIIFAATCLPHSARFTGNTCSTEGAAPIVH
jgi:hypothetical protein